MSKLKKLVLVMFIFGLFLGGKLDITMNVDAASSNSYNSDDFYIENNVLQFYLGDDTNVTIPNTVTSIGEYAFAWNEELESVTIPNSVTKIREGAFEGCTNLSNITVPNSVTSIGSYAFSGCIKLKTINLPNNIKSISSEMLSGCDSLKSIKIPSTVTSIGSYAFAECISLSEINIPNSVTSIGESAFETCVSLTSVTLPSNLKVINDFLFAECTNLSSVKLPSGLTSIKDSVFYECDKLNSLTIPASVNYISSIAFTNYTNPNLKIYVTKGSYAERYAKNNYIPYKYTTSTTTTKLSTVTGLKQSSNTTSSIKLSWNKVSNGSGYEVYRATSKTGTYTKIKTISGNSILSYTDTGLTSGKVYYYKVRAVKSSTKGSFSSILTSSTKCKTPAVTLTSQKTKTVKISWKKVSGASGYKIYRSTSKNGKYANIKTITSGSTLSYTNSGLSKGKTYYYKVIAYKNVNSKPVISSYSTVKSIKCK